ncbi:GntR family transcriptional regulator [Spirillospora sp. NBC_01491]|uniref:GntR family transcriptional regulator n=1 Tax=Spirillospora sp. NBC_01491 TaxID=2976007 RepID=UPI002E30E381|nr:GntR family transcriptional regulator [Spirillospora sp. NBC_01491]
MSDDAAYTPKYVQIMETLRRRIADGTYPPNETLPSESKLIKEFGASRPTVVRALNEMQLKGEVQREHGRGTFPMPPRASVSEHSRPGLAVLDRQETESSVKVDEVGRRPAPSSVAALLGLAESAPVHLRRYVAFHDSVASEVVSLWAPLDVARSTGLDHDGPLTVPVRRLLTAGVEDRLTRLTERLCARRPTEIESKLLGLGAAEPVLSVVGSVLDSTDRAVLVVEITLPGTLHELEDSYAL